jgi:hypothetical protein
MSMRKPGFKKFPIDALRETDAEIRSCPVCASELKQGPRVTQRSCEQHGTFTIRWSTAKKRIIVMWDFYMYLPDDK